MMDNELDKPIAKDFLFALERLRNGRPENGKNKKNPKAINPTSLAREAGHARGLIAYDGCAYPQVRLRMLAAMKQTDSGGSGREAADHNAGPVKSAMKVITDLRQTKAELRSERNMYATLLAEADLYIGKEAKLARSRSDRNRAKDGSE